MNSSNGRQVSPREVRNFLYFRLIGLAALFNSLIARLIKAFLFWPKNPRMRGDFYPNRGRRVLIIRLDEIGDLTMTSGFLRELRGALPSAEIALVVKRGVENLFETCPYVSQVIGFDCNVRQYYRPFLLPWRALRLGWALRREKYDVALLPRREADWCYGTLVAYYSDAPIRVGYTRHISDVKPLVNLGFDALLTHLVQPDPTAVHEVEHNMEFLRRFGIEPQEDRLELWPDEADVAVVNELLETHGVTQGEGFIAICPSPGGSIYKQWPAARFAEVARYAAQRYSLASVIVGGPGDRELASSICRAAPACINITGLATLRQTAALLRRAKLMVTNDTGPMHIAAAVGTPVIAVFGSSCHHMFGPWGRHEVVGLNLPCNPCNQGHKHDRCKTCIYEAPLCMTGITADQVWSRMEKVIATVIPNNDLTQVQAIASPVGNNVG